MVPLKFIRKPILHTHHSHGLRVPTSRYLSHTPVRRTRKRRAGSGRFSLPTATASRSKNTSEESVADRGRVTVNLFEIDDLSKHSKILPSNHPDSEISALEQFDKELDKEIENIDKKLESSGSVTKSTQSLIESIFTREQIASIRQRVADLAVQDSFDSLAVPHHINPKAELPDSSAVFLHKLNEALDAASIRPKNEKVRRNLWRYYERGKLYIPDLLIVLPDEAWAILWTALSENSPLNPNRMSHIRILCEDMLQAGRTLNQEQRFARVEGLFLDDEQQTALKLWEAGLENGDAGNPEYLEMGIQMYCQMNNLKRAEELLYVLFSLYVSWNPRIIISVLMACLKLGTREGFDKAFALYMRLRDRLSSDMTMDDYDQVSLGFLRAGQKDYALAVFRDMMLTADAETLNNLPYGTILARMGSFMSLSKDAEEVNSLLLDSLSFVPRKFQNKFFYASWMKKLIGMGHLDDAAQIVELMYERGVKPDAKHVNGLIGGWFRTGHRASHAGAEKTAWAMIQGRLDFVRERRQRIMSGIDAPQKSVHDNTEGVQLPALDQRPTPPATIETFSILVQYYLRRGLFQNVRHLRNLLVDAEIPMNSYFMNHLLFAELRNRTHREVWTRFEVMSRTVTPDIETFACLWECMKSHVNPARNSDPSGFPNPRQLFARMRSWLNNLTGQHRRDAQEDLNINLYNDIIHSFCLARDIEGSFVALHAMKEDWGLLPEPKTIRMLIMQIARLTAPLPRNLGKPSHRKSRNFTASRENQEQTAHAVQVLDIITRDRRAEMEAHGLKFEDLDSKQQGEENHRAVLQLLHNVLMEVRGDSFDGFAAIREVATELGIEHFDVEDAMALQV